MWPPIDAGGKIVSTGKSPERLSDGKSSPKALKAVSKKTVGLTLRVGFRLLFSHGHIRS
jgi:hypothetical protein